MLQSIASVQKRNQIFVENGERLERRAFRELGYLGSGSFARVIKVSSVATGQSYAFKVLSLEKIRKLQLLSKLKFEIDILSRANHDCIIRLFGAFQEQDEVFLIMELAETTLFYKMRQEFPLAEAQIAALMADVVRGVVYLHSLNPPIIHRDLKLENVLVVKGRCKIADFGWSSSSADVRQTYCGTLEYLAPEMVKKEAHDEKLDIWTLGIMIFELLEGKPPFDVRDLAMDKRLRQKTIQDNILRGELSFRLPHSPEAVEAVKALARLDKNDRPSAREIFNLEFFRKNLRGLARNRPPKAAASPLPARGDPKPPLSPLFIPSSGFQLKSHHSAALASPAEPQAFLPARAPTPNAPRSAHHIPVPAFPPSRVVITDLPAPPPAPDPPKSERQALMQKTFNEARELRARAEALERRNGQLQLQLEARRRATPPAQPGAPELRRLNDELDRALRQLQADTDNMRTIVLAHRLLLDNQEISDMVYGFLRKAQPADGCFDRAALDEILAEIRRLFAELLRPPVHASALLPPHQPSAPQLHKALSASVQSSVINRSNAFIDRPAASAQSQFRPGAQSLFNSQVVVPRLQSRPQ